MLYNSSMRFSLIFLNYVAWHYSEGIANAFTNLKNLVSFVYDFFSINNLARTLFAPWRKLGEPYPNRFDLPAFFTALIINTLMRIVGFLIRASVLITGLILFTLSLVLAILAFALWLLLPLVLFVLLVYGLYFLVS